MKIEKKYSFALSIILLLFFGCSNKDLEMDSFKIDMDRAAPSVDSVSITGSYSFVGIVKGMAANIGEKESLSEVNIYEMKLDGTNFSVTIGGLKPSTQYYYCYLVDFGTNDALRTEIKSFTTLDIVTEKPIVKTLEVLAIDSTTFRVKCEVISDGGSEITECGICWNNYGDPSMDDEIMQYANGGLGQYTLRLENLSLTTKYYVRAYAKNANGISFGEVLDFRTGSETTTLPIVSTVEVSDETYNTATCLCNVISNGGLELIERGVCWGLELEPTINVHHTVAEGTETGSFVVTIEGLTPSTTYHVRAYATNEKGTNYGEDLTFTTADGLPYLTTATINDITVTSAMGGGEVIEEGASPVRERGICWNTTGTPSIDDYHESNGLGLGFFTVNMTGLTPNEIYYVKAYAINDQGTAYGDVVEFNTLDGLPTVETLDVFNITVTSAKAQGKLTDQGYSEVIEWGICWGIEHNPTINDNYGSSSLISENGVYSVSLTRLAPGTQYYVRAYAKNAQGIAYGNERSFETD